MVSRDYTINSNYPLTPEQNELVEFMIQRPACINAAQTGLGKTYSTLTAMAHVLSQHKDLIAVIVVPPKALKVFRKELKQKLKVSYSELSKQQVTNGKSRIFLISQTSIKEHIKDLQELRKTGYKLMMILDEAHICQGEDNAFTITMRTIRHMFAIWWMLTATPLGNDVWGLYNLMYLVNPKIFISKEMFAKQYFITERQRVKRYDPSLRRYVFPWEDVIVGYRDIEQLKKDIKDFVIIKQKHYNLDFIYHKTDITQTEEQNYLKASAGMARETSKKNFAVRVNDLQQVVDNVSKKYGDPNILASKERLFVQTLLQEINDHGIIVYAEQYETIDRLELLCKMLKTKGHPIRNIYKITGSQDFTERAKVEDNLGRSDVVLITQAGTESINLQAADTIFLYNIPFSVKVLIQLVGRVTRVDSKYPRQYIHFIEAHNTIDTYRRLLISMRGGVINKIFGDIETLPVELTIEDEKIAQKLRNKLLWTFSYRRLPTEEEIEQIIYS